MNAAVVAAAEGGVAMDGVPARSLIKEVSESVLLFAIAAFTLGGYLGIALFFVEAMK